jgi:hypothetical protein
VYAEVGMLLTKKTRLTSEMLSTSQASEPGLFIVEERIKLALVGLLDRYGLVGVLE